ncbi:MAG: DUF5711 family protein [Ruminococcus sp.]|jgi:hypothetical protein|nr:DUF5711 family protein [Ruminococcus sp.]
MSIDISALRKKQKKDKIKKIVISVLIFFVIAAVVLVIVFTHDRWYPKMEGILTKVPELPGTAKEVTLAEGNFPLALPEAETIHARTVSGTDGGIALVTDTKTALYDKNGNEILGVSHNYGNPALFAYGTEFAAYDIGGKTLSVYKNGRVRFTKTLDEQILLVRVFDGLCGVVTIGSKHPAVLTVFDNTGRNIFSFKSVERITDVTFDREKKGVYITLLSSKGGDLVTKLVYYSFTETAKDDSGAVIPIHESDWFNTLSLSVTLIAAQSEDLLLLIGDRELVILSSSLSILKQQIYADFGNLKDYSVTDSAAVVLFEGKTSNSSDLLIMGADYNIREMNINKNIVAVSAVSNEYGILALSEDNIDRIDITGKDFADIKIPGVYNNMYTADGYIYLSGYGEINRLDLPSE